jgi:HPt (histidine-containing phosphotransfer) domain-containing protein
MFLLKPFRADELLTAIENLLPKAQDVRCLLAEPDRACTIVIDRLKALMRANPAPGFVRKTVELFTQFDAPDALASLKTATTATAQRSLLHALAGSSANVGAMAFSALCREKMALSDDALIRSKELWAETVRLEMLTVVSELAKAVTALEQAATATTATAARSS